MSARNSTRYHIYNFIFLYRFANGNTGNKRWAIGETGKIL